MTILWRDQFDSELFHLGTQEGQRVIAWTTLSDEGINALLGAEVRRVAERLVVGCVMPIFLEGSVGEEEEEEKYAGKKPF